MTGAASHSSGERGSVRGYPSAIPAPYLIMTILALIVAAASLAAFYAGRAPGNGSAEAGFARDMSVHHAQAVEMSQIILNKTENERIRTLAIDITLTQQGQIGQMQGWLAAWGLPYTRTEPAMAWMGHPTEGQMPGMASPADLNRLREAPPEQADHLFLQLMIPHHGAAIPMSEAVLERTNREEVEQLAGAISASQQAEIEIMRAMLAEMGGSVPHPPSVTDHGAHGS